MQSLKISYIFARAENVPYIVNIFMYPYQWGGGQIGKGPVGIGLTVQNISNLAGRLLPKG